MGDKGVGAMDRGPVGSGWRMWIGGGVVCLGLAFVAYYMFWDPRCFVDHSLRVRGSEDGSTHCVGRVYGKQGFQMLSCFGKETEAAERLGKMRSEDQEVVRECKAVQKDHRSLGPLRRMLGLV